MDRTEQLYEENRELRRQSEHYAKLAESRQKRIDELEQTIGKRVAPVRYAIIRFAPDYPQEWRSQELDGRWFDLDEINQICHLLSEEERGVEAVARAIDFYEARSDGRVGQVFEISMRARDILKAGAAQ